MAATHLARSEKITVREATARLMARGEEGSRRGAEAQRGEGDAGAGTEGKPVAEAPVVKVSALEEQKAKIEEIKGKLREAGKAFDTDLQADLQVELSEAVAQRMFLESQQAEAAKKTETAAETAWQKTEGETFSAMETAYPDFQKAGTPLNVAVNARIAALEKSNPAFFNDPEWVRLVVRDQAVELGIAPAGRQSAAEAPAKATAAKVAPRQAGHPAAMTPAPGNAGAGVSSEEEVAALLNSNDPKALMAYLRKNGQRA